MADEVLNLLCSSAKLDRDRGVAELSKYLKTIDASLVQGLESAIEGLLCDSLAPWESRHGGLMGTKHLLLNETHACSDHFADISKDHAMKLLEDEESRVRLGAGEISKEEVSTTYTHILFICLEILYML